MNDPGKMEQERLSELQSFNILDTPSEKEFDEIVQLASLICETPMSLITLIDKDRQWFKSKIGVEGTETSRDIAFCNYAIQDDHLMMVENATKDRRFADNPMVTGDPNVRFYAGMPLISSSGYKLGTLCVIDREPRILSPSQQFSLEILAKQVTKQMEIKKLNSQL